jgi:hypothetical protein
MLRFTTICCWLIGTGAIAVSAIGTLHPVLTSSRTIAKLDEAALQHLAENACRCERSAGSGGQKACWAEFDRQLPPPAPPATDEFTACVPVETQIRCGGTGSETKLPDGSISVDQGPCIPVRYRYSGSADSVLLCSQAEASAVERAFNREARPDADGHVRTPVADKLARDLVAGHPIPKVDGPSGCASS